MGVSALMLLSSISSYSSSLYPSNPRYSSSSSLSLLSLLDGRVWGLCPLTTVSGHPVFAISLSKEGEGGGVLARLNIPKTSLCHRGFSVPSTLGLSSLKILLYFAFAVLGRGLLTKQPWDWETACQRGPLARTAGMGGCGQHLHPVSTARACLFYADTCLGTSNGYSALVQPIGALQSVVPVPVSLYLIFVHILLTLQGYAARGKSRGYPCAGRS